MPSESVYTLPRPIDAPSRGHRETTGDWHAALRVYLLTIAGGNLVWEFLQLPLYTIWQTGGWSDVAFAALHCTGGDVLIALSALMLALLLIGSMHWPDQRFWPVAALTILLGVLYTLFSEWLNIEIRAAWAYSDKMPVVNLFGFHVGLSPVAQWLVIPGAAFLLISRRQRSPGAWGHRPSRPQP
jgi:hypothetical protein